MSALVQSLLVFGNVYFYNPVANTPPIGNDPANATLIPNIDRRFGQTEEFSVSRRGDYTYTPGIGAHKVHTQSASWSAARKTCLEEGGYLAIINSVAEAEHVKRLAVVSKPYAGASNSDYVLIGFHDRYHDDEYITVHGESLIAAGFNEWDSGEPSKTGEDCGSLNCVTGKLNDISCTLHYAFVCELPRVQL